MKNRVALAREALRMAMTLRKQAGIDRVKPVCIYDLLEERFGVEVKFVSAKSMEGIYVKGTRPTILVSSERPAGRRAYTCAHEFGHHAFGHGFRVDQCLGEEGQQESNDCEEWLADRFAGFFLMPQHVVERAFTIRNWKCDECNPGQVYTVAGQLGVGYETLVRHMGTSLKILNEPQVRSLLRTSPKQIRQSLVGDIPSSHLILVDTLWETSIAVDLEVGDHAIMPNGSSVRGSTVRIVGERGFGMLVEAYLPGTERAWQPDSSWAVNIRVSRKDYAGRSLFRHLEDPNHE